MGSLLSLPILELFDLAQKKLERSVDSQHRSLAAWTLLVAIGLMLEYGPDLAKLCGKKTIEKHPYLWMRVYAFVGPILITAGVAGELFVGAQFGLAEAQLRSFGDSSNAQLRKTAAEATERAAKAESHLAGAHREAADANKKAGEANERASGNEKEAARLRKEAEDERMARVKLEESVAWRSLSAELIKELAPSLQKFTGQRCSISFDRNQPERIVLFRWIMMLLSESKWEFEAFGSGSELKLPSTNIVIWVTPAAPEPVINAARALVDALTRAKLAASFFQSSWGPQPEATPVNLIRIVIFEKGPTVVFKPAN